MKFRRVVVAAMGLLVAATSAHAATYEILHSFNVESDGSDPRAVLLRGKDGVLYGTTSNGGIGSCYSQQCGVVFSLTPPRQGISRWTYKVLHRFAGIPDGGISYSPLVIDANGVLYGTTFAGGAGDPGFGMGVVFRLAPPCCGQSEWNYSVIHTFNGAPNDGEGPMGGLFLSESGALYGTTEYGGRHGHGSVYKLRPPPTPQAPWTFSLLYSFPNNMYWDPFGSLVADSRGNFFGVTSGGGRQSCHCGSLFKLSPPAGGATQWRLTLLHSFANSPDGATPEYALILRDNILYGGTVQGGAGNGGVVFIYDLTKNKYGLVHKFTGSEGATINSTLFADARGALYGVAGFDNVHFSGTVFKLSPPPSGMTAWTATVLHTFTGKPRDGSAPYGGLVKIPGGPFVGTTGIGGSKNLGTIFSLSP
ncbi:MAG: choice-of-anchor tandem repeat GloVer-containing protein [Pseudolabrys sp.]